MSQYQAYSPPTNTGSPAPHYSTPQPHGQHPFQQSYQQPQQSTFPPQAGQQPPHPNQPNMAYQAPQQMSEKPQPQIEVNAHKEHNHGSKFGSKWVFGFFDCFKPLDTCCLGCWCPCILFGRTYARDHGEGETSGASLMCCAWYTAACMGFNSCFQCIMRQQQRDQFGIEGNVGVDFAAGLCCSCCLAIQSEKESIVRNTGIDPVTKVAYQPISQSMEYPA